MQQVYAVPVNKCMVFKCANGQNIIGIRLVQASPLECGWLEIPEASQVEKERKTPEYLGGKSSHRANNTANNTNQPRLGL